MFSRMSIRRQVMIVNISLTSILLIAFVANLVIANAASERERMAYEARILDASIDRFEREHMRLRALKAICAQDPTFIMALANRNGVSRFVSDATIAGQKLAMIGNAMPYATTVYAYMPASDRVITRAGRVVAAQTVREQYAAKLSPGESLPDLKTVRDGFLAFDRFLLYMMRVQDYGTIWIEIDPETFAGIDSIAEMMQRQCAILAPDGSVFAATAPGVGDIAQAVDADDRARSGDDADDAIWRADWNGEKQRVQRGRATIDGYRFYLMTPVRLVDASQRAQGVGAVLAALAIAGLCVLVVLLNHRIYAPLRMLTTKLRREPTGNEFALLDRRLTELSSQNAHMRSQIGKGRALQHDLALNFAVFQHERPSDGAIEVLRESWPRYAVVVVSAQDASGASADCLDVCDEEVARIDGVSLRIDEGSRACVLACEADDRIADVSRRLERALRRAADAYERHGILLCAGISDIGEDVARLNAAYEQARHRMYACEINEEDAVAVCDAVPAAPAPPAPLPLDMQADIARYAMSGEIDALQTMLARLLLEGQGRTLGGMAAIYRAIGSILTTALASRTDATPALYAMRAQAAYNPAYMMRCLIEDARAVARACEDAREAEGAQQVPRYPIAEYIQEHYAEPLSLDSIAAHFGITPVYLSTWFKKNVGINLSTHLAQIRIDEAKKLLRSSDATIAEVCARVGMPSVATFSRQFRARTGMTPTRYRELGGE